MRRWVIPLLGLSFVAACSPDDPSSTSAGLVVTDRCEISGLGTLVDGDFVAGDVRGGDTGATGTWLHNDDEGVVLGEASWILCRLNGAILGDFGGAATVDERAGYTFRVTVQDLGDPSEPLLVAGPAEVQALEATRTYSPSRWADGHVAIDERAIVTIPTELPVSVGNAGNQWAWLSFQRSETSDVVTCRYRGGASTPSPSEPGEIAAGASYALERCTGELDGSPPVEGGDAVDVRWMTLRVQSGDHTSPSRHAAQTTIRVDLSVTPITLTDREPDHYRISVWDDATGDRVFFRDAALATGDLRLVLLD